MALRLASEVSVGTTAFTMGIEAIVFCFAARELMRWRTLTPGSPNSAAGRLSKKSVQMIASMSFFAVLNGAGIMCNSLVGLVPLDPNVPSQLCTAIIPKLYVAAYGMVQISFCEFMRVRSLLVESPADNTLLFRALRFFTTYAIRIAGPLFVIVLLIWWSGTIVEVDGVAYCVDTNNWAFNVAYVALALPLQFAFLFLFVAPLWQHAHEMKKLGSISTASDSIFRVIRRNFILSLVAITSLSFTMIFMAVVSVSYQGQSVMVTASICYSDFDVLINLTCMCLMTYHWLPPHLRPKSRDETRTTITTLRSPIEGEIVKFQRLNDDEKSLSPNRKNPEI